MQLDVAGLKSGYGKVQILHGIDFRAPLGEITAVLGPNGAGKSTLMKTIAGHLPVMAGDIRFRGTSLVGKTALGICREGIGYVPQVDNVFAEMTVRDNLLASALAFEDAGRRIDEVMARFPILRERGHQPASTLSGGERQTLAIATALVAGPEILLLDEPTAGLAPIFVDRILSWMGDLVAAGMGIVWVVEQNPEKILAVSKTAFVIDAGRNSETIDARQLLEPGRLEEVLLQFQDQI
ncbi:MAG: ABC transporter ATP-binding protein [Roseovarius sp.]